MKSKKDYEGTYRIRARPQRMVGHNAESWQKIEAVIDKRGGKADFDELAVAVRHHRHGTKTSRHPYQFVTYCIRRGWLERS